MTKEEVLERLVGAYTAYFNIRRDTELDGLPVAMDAEYHVRNEQYVLSREAKLWEAENDEYAFVVVLEELDPENLRAYYDAVLKEGMSRVDPRANHMRTDITMLVLADRIQPEAAAALKKLKYSKSFLFTLRGWAQFRAAALEVSTGQTYANGLGKAVLKDLGRHLSV